MEATIQACSPMRGPGETAAVDGAAPARVSDYSLRARTPLILEMLLHEPRDQQIQLIKRHIIYIQGHSLLSQH